MNNSKEFNKEIDSVDSMVTYEYANEFLINLITNPPAANTKLQEAFKRYNESKIINKDGTVSFDIENNT